MNSDVGLGIFSRGRLMRFSPCSLSKTRILAPGDCARHVVDTIKQSAARSFFITAFNILPRVQRADGGIINPSQFFPWLSPPSDLLHKRKEIADTPMVGDLAVLDTHDIDRLEMDFTVSWSDAKKVPFVSAVVRLGRCHAVTIGKLPVDVRMKVGECGTNIRV